MSISWAYSSMVERTPYKGVTQVQFLLGLLRQVECEKVIVSSNLISPSFMGELLNGSVFFYYPTSVIFAFLVQLAEY